MALAKVAALRMGALAAASTPAVALSSFRGMSYFDAKPGTKGVKGFSEHELAVENQYFNKEDEQALLRLLKKVSKASTSAETPTTVAAAAAEEAALKAILAPLNPPQKIIDAVIAWKHAHY